MKGDLAMLVGNLHQADDYKTLLQHPVWKKAFDWLQENQETIPNDGEYEIQGHDLRAIVQTISVKPKADEVFESHRREIDLQCCLTGEDAIACSPIDRLSPATEYDEEKDFILYSVPESTSRLSLKPGDFAIFFQGDGHMPNLTGEGSRKVVIKINRQLLESQFVVEGPFELQINRQAGSQHNFETWISRGKFGRTNINVNSQNFPLQAPSKNGLDRTTAYLANFGRTVANEDVPRLLAKQGYQALDHSWLLELNAEKPELMDTHIMIHHESAQAKVWLGPEDTPEVVCLHKDKGVRRLRTHYSNTDWGPHIWWIVEKIN